MKQILLIEHEESYRNALVDLLDANGFETQGVASCQGALKMINQQDFNLIITSLYMPCINGFELVEKINVLKPKIPIVVSSSHIDKNIYDTLLQLGAFECYSKPIDLDKFSEIVNRGIDENEQRLPSLRREG